MLYGFISSNTTMHNPACRTRVLDGPGLYYLGIIDYLQKYTFAKKLERFWKVWIRCLDEQGISDVNPNRYKDRLIEKVFGKVCLMFDVHGFLLVFIIIDHHHYM